MLFSKVIFVIGCASLVNCAVLGVNEPRHLDAWRRNGRFNVSNSNNGNNDNANANANNGNNGNTGNTGNNNNGNNGNNGNNNGGNNGNNNGGNNNGNSNGGNNNGGNKQQLILASSNLQSASMKTGQEQGTDGIKPGQARSATDNANFINFCSGQTITNGQQITKGSCNGIPMGKIPSTDNMISAMITNPQIGDRIPAGKTFNISVQTSNLAAGSFVNPTTNYYTAPQDLDNQGKIIGHCHVTVQEIGSLKSKIPPNPKTFAFFKGIDDAGDGKGLLQAVVADGLPIGVYRVCTMIAARNHQPVNMPVAQRGAQDDCTKFEVVAEQGGQGGGRGDQGKKNAGDANTGKMESGKVDGKAKDQ